MLTSPAGPGIGLGKRDQTGGVGVVRYLTDVRHLGSIPTPEREKLADVTRQYAFKATDYYLSLIDWTDPADPLRRIVVPSAEELEGYGDLDPSEEAANYVARGCQHKYAATALLLVTSLCACYCRFCFRKRLLLNGHEEEVSRDISGGLAYIAAHHEITNILVTGGDPLLLAPERLERILSSLQAVPHVRVVRIGSKLPAFEPSRLYGNPDLLEVLARHSRPDARLYVMTHFNHPRELTPEALKALDALVRAGVVMANQTPLLRGVNDDPVVLAELFERLAAAGAPPYYVFQNRPVAGNSGFAVPLQEAYTIMEVAKSRVSGLGKRARLVMSHATGKIEVLAVEGERISLKYHQARNPGEVGSVISCRLPDGAAWLDDLEL